MLGGKKKHQAAVAAAREAHALAESEWADRCRELDVTYRTLWTKWEGEEASRKDRLTTARARYDTECREREASVTAGNEELSQLKNGLAFDIPEAIEEYVQIVLANSSYPDFLSIETTSAFDLSSRELVLHVAVPPPDTLPAVKAYKYLQSADEIAPVALPLKDQKARYSGMIDQVAVRTLHEIFEADRAEKIHSVALTVAVRRISPATGLSEDVPMVQVAADRREFMAFDLSNVVPAATLEHLGASVSKNPFAVMPANVSPGVRKRSTP